MEKLYLQNCVYITMQFDIRRFDIYRKVPKDLTQPTNTGAAISICCIFFISFLLFSELYAFIIPEVSSQLFVYNTGESSQNFHEKIPVRLDISVFNVECRFLGIDIQDDMGRHDVGFIEDTNKLDINSGRGCRLKTVFHINKVPGNFHVSTHASQEQPVETNMAHEIHDLTFGDHVEHLRSIPESSFNALNFVSKLDKDPSASHDYIMKIVPTIYEQTNGDKLFPFQYTYAYRDYIPYIHGTFKAPSTVWFRYDLNPITVKYTEKRKPIYSFLTSVCAIIGGTFTVTGIVDSLIFTASELFKKYEMGKLG